MSRGLGKVERRVLHDLAQMDAHVAGSIILRGHDGYWYLESLLPDGPEDVMGVPDRPPRSQVESTRRAVRSLRRKGLVKTGRRPDGLECIRVTVALTDSGRETVS